MQLAVRVRIKVRVRGMQVNVRPFGGTPLGILYRKSGQGHLGQRLPHRHGHIPVIHRHRAAVKSHGNPVRCLSGHGIYIFISPLVHPVRHHGSMDTQRAHTNRIPTIQGQILQCHLILRRTGRHEANIMVRREVRLQVHRCDIGVVISHDSQRTFERD